jgi:acyl-CoA thioesterase-1
MMASMFRHLVRVTVLACAAAIGRAEAASPRIVALGDSLTSGQGIGQSNAYPAVLQEMLDRAGLELLVVNAGVAGDTSGRAAARVDRAIEGDVRILIVALGANDGLRGTPVSQITANLGLIIETARRHGISVLLCGMEALPVHGWDYSVAFHLAFREIAERFQVPLVPFMLTNVIGDANLMQRDRIHPNAAGAREIAATIWPYLKPLAEEVVATK